MREYGDFCAGFITCLAIIGIIISWVIAGDAFSGQYQISKEEMDARQRAYSEYAEAQEYIRQDAIRINKEKKNWSSYSKSYRRNPEPSNPYYYNAPEVPNFKKRPTKYRRTSTRVSK